MNMKNNSPKPEQGVRKVIEHRSRDSLRKTTSIWDVLKHNTRIFEPCQYFTLSHIGFVYPRYNCVWAFAICFWGAGKNRLPKRISLLIVDAKKNSNWICALIEFWPANDSKKLMCKNSQLLKVDFLCWRLESQLLLTSWLFWRQKMIGEFNFLYYHKDKVWDQLRLSSDLEPNHSYIINV